MEKNIQEALISVIADTLTGFNLGTDLSAQVTLDFPTDSRFGELSTNIPLRLSKILKKAPVQIANDFIPALKKNLGEHDLGRYIKDVKAEGAGFINFYLSSHFFHDYLKSVVDKGVDFLKIDYGKKKPVLIEFVSANPTGSLSVAHARQAAVGDSLANILNFLGFEAKREYYLNDEGNQINILGASVALRIRELQGEKIDFPENYYQGSYVYDVAKKAIEEKTGTHALGDYAAGYILDIIKKELDDLGVKFDYWYSQKELNKSGQIKAALAGLSKRGFLYDQDGAVWFKSTDLGDDKDRVVVKSDGSYTYLAPDIAYHEEKYKRGFSWLINLWGPDHHGYINRLKASVKAFGHPDDSLSVIIVQLATISRNGKPVQMSTRKGQYITLREVLDEVGPDAARFFFVMRRTSSHLDFDLEVAKKQTSENPVYYVQYAYARIGSILRNSQLNPGDSGIDFFLLKEKEELLLIKKLWQFSSTLNICLVTQDPYMLTVYLQELSELFHKFYDEHRVLGEDEKLSFARLSLCGATRTVLATGLGLLGISLPEKM